MRKYDYTWKSTKIFIFCFLLNVFFILLLGLQLSAFIYFLIQTLKIWLNLLWFLSLLITFFFKFVLWKSHLSGLFCIFLPNCLQLKDLLICCITNWDKNMKFWFSLKVFLLWLVFGCFEINMLMQDFMLAYFLFCKPLIVNLTHP